MKSFFSAAIFVFSLQLFLPALKAQSQLPISGFNGGAGFVANGGPLFNGNTLTVTDDNLSEARSVFYSTQQSISAFTAGFTYSAAAGSTFLADGATFVIENDPAGVNALGAIGGSLGYAGFGGGPGGISPSVALEFNVFAGHTRGIQVATNGSVFNYISTMPVDLASGDPVAVQIFYSSGMMHVILTDTVNGNAFSHDFPVDIPGVLGQTQAWVGFTGATGGFGGGTAIQTFSSFIFSSAGASCGAGCSLVTFTSVPGGVPIQVNSTNASTPYIVEANPGSTLNVAVTQLVNDGSPTRYQFSGWADGVAALSRTITVPNANVTFTPDYLPQNSLQLFAVPTAGGSISATPATGGYYNASDAVSIAAAPAAGFVFTGFSGDLSGSVSPALLNMSAPRSVTANFSSGQAPSLTVSIRNDVSRTAQPGPVVTAQIAFQNSGGTASNATVTALSARVLSPANLLASVSSPTPIAVGTIPNQGSSNAISIQLNIPAAAVRTSVQGTITYSGGSSAFSFTIIRSALTAPVPSITSIAPSGAPRGRTVKITGTNFDSNCNNDTISVGGAAIHPTPPCSSTALSFQVPLSAAAGPTNLQVATTASQASNSQPFAVLATRVVVAATPTPTGGANFSTDQVSFIDFSDPANPTVQTLSPGFASGSSVVDCSGSHAAVGDALGGLVALYDISNPSAPAKLATLNTQFANIGAIKFSGTNVLAGQAFGAEVVLIDARNPSSPSILSTLSQIFGIQSLGMSGVKAVASGMNATMAIIDYTDPAHPTWSTFLPRGGSALNVDLDGNLAAVGGQDQHLVSLVDISIPSVVSRADPQICQFSLPPGCVGTPTECASPTCVTSVSIKGNTVAVGSDTHRYIALMDFTNRANPAVSMFDPQLGVAAPTVVFDGQYLAAGGINSAFTTSFVNLFQIAGGSATLLGGINSGLPSVGTIGMCTF